MDTLLVLAHASAFPVRVLASFSSFYTRGVYSVRHGGEPVPAFPSFQHCRRTTTVAVWNVARRDRVRTYYDGACSHAAVHGFSAATAAVPSYWLCTPRWSATSASRSRCDGTRCTSACYAPTCSTIWRAAHSGELSRHGWPRAPSSSSPRAFVQRRPHGRGLQSECRTDSC